MGPVRAVCCSCDLLVLPAQRFQAIASLSATRNVFVREVTARTGPRGYVGSLILFPSALSHPLIQGLHEGGQTSSTRSKFMASINGINTCRKKTQMLANVVAFV
jgi:hypothetical protein